MGKIKITLLIFIILINFVFATGCWNYREIDKLAIVAGVAVDKGTENQFKMTVEIIQMSGENDTKMTSKLITAEGKTMFDTTRNIIALSGKKLYWSHTKVIVLSREIASEGVNKAVEWYNRDAETREDVYILISEAASAKEIFTGQGTTEDIKSFVLSEIIENQVSLSKSPMTDLLEYNIESKAKGISPIIPSVDLKKTDGKMIPELMGAAIIEDNKLVGFLNGEETKDVILIKNEVKGGLLIEEMQGDDVNTFVSLEIFKNKTKITPIVEGKDIKINVNMDTTVGIGEISGTENFIDDEGQKKLKESVENNLEKRIQSFIKKIQSEYDADIFGFGERLREDKVQVWKDVGDNWQNVFKELDVTVEAKVHIKNSAILSESLEEGE